MKIAVYNQNCVLVGRRAFQVEEEGDWENGDVTVYEGTDFELWETAEAYWYDTTSTPDSLYRLRVARTLAAAIGCLDALEGYNDQEVLED